MEDRLEDHRENGRGQEANEDGAFDLTDVENNREKQAEDEDQGGLYNIDIFPGKSLVHAPYGAELPAHATGFTMVFFR